MFDCWWSREVVSESRKSCPLRDRSWALAARRCRSSTSCPPAAWKTSPSSRRRLPVRHFWVSVFVLSLCSHCIRCVTVARSRECDAEIESCVASCGSTPAVICARFTQFLCEFVGGRVSALSTSGLSRERQRDATNGDIFYPRAQTTGESSLRWSAWGGGVGNRSDSPLGTANRLGTARSPSAAAAAGR